MRAFLIRLMLCPSPAASLMGASPAFNAMALFFISFFGGFSNSALASQADEDGGCSFKTNYGASTGAECTPRRMIRSGVHSGDERGKTDQHRSHILVKKKKKKHTLVENTSLKKPFSTVFNVGQRI